MSKLRKPIRTDHQQEIMGIVLAEMRQGREITAREIFDRLSYAAGVSFGALRKTIEGLEKQELIYRRREGMKVYVLPTQRGMDWFWPLQPNRNIVS